MHKQYVENEPIVLGLCGKAGSGKTSIANKIFYNYQDWEKYNLAGPIYEMATAKQKIKGEYTEDRVLYAIHEAIVDLFGGSTLYGGPSYDTIVSLTHQIAALPIEPDGVKPRTFLQTIGMLFREIDSDVFSKRLLRRIRQASLVDGQYNGRRFVIDDVRFPNEAKRISNMPNGILFKLLVDEDERQRRLDEAGNTMSSTQMSHASEMIDDIPIEYIHAVVDTNTGDVEQITKTVYRTLMRTLGIAHAQA